MKNFIVCAVADANIRVAVRKVSDKKWFSVNLRELTLGFESVFTLAFAFWPFFQGMANWHYQHCSYINLYGTEMYLTL